MKRLPLALLLLTGPALAAPAASPITAPQLAPAVTPAQAELLQKIRRLRDSEARVFGACSYAWNRWQLQPTGARTTTVTGCGTASVAVACTALKVSTLPVAEPPVWSAWRLPEAGPEEQMLVSLCANALPVPVEAKPATDKRP